MTCMEADGRKKAALSWLFLDFEPEVKQPAIPKGFTLDRAGKKCYNGFPDGKVMLLFLSFSPSVGWNKHFFPALSRVADGGGNKSFAVWHMEVPDGSGNLYVWN